MGQKSRLVSKWSLHEVDLAGRRNERDEDLVQKALNIFSKGTTLKI